MIIIIMRMKGNIVRLIKLITQISVVMALASGSSHAAFISDNDFLTSKENILIYKPNLKNSIEFEETEVSCYGCLSTHTYRPRTNWVRPHYRPSSGRYIGGYWRS